MTWDIFSILLLVGIDPYGIDVLNRLAAPSMEHWMGTDALGRDVFARVVAGTTVTFLISMVVVTISSVVGILVGCFVHRFPYDVVLTLPMFVLLIMLSMLLGQGTLPTVVAMILIWWAPIAKLTRSFIDIEMEKEYVEAARAMGFSNARILLRHVLPNCRDRLHAYIQMDFGTVVMVYAGLGFLGLGTIPPTPELGSMLYENRDHFQQWWLIVFPGLALLIVALCVSSTKRVTER